MVPENVTLRIWSLLPACRNAGLLRAASFFRTSLDEVDFTPGDVYDVRAFGEEADVPASILSIARFESAFVNAYKAVEAIIGDPSRDDRKFEQQIRQAGIDPAVDV